MIFKISIIKEGEEGHYCKANKHKHGLSHKQWSRSVSYAVHINQTHYRYRQDSKKQWHINAIKIQADTS